MLQISPQIAPLDHIRMKARARHFIAHPKKFQSEIIRRIMASVCIHQFNAWRSLTPNGVMEYEKYASRAYRSGGVVDTGKAHKAEPMGQQQHRNLFVFLGMVWGVGRCWVKGVCVGGWLE
jgi:hypothetical protein